MGLGLVMEINEVSAECVRSASNLSVEFFFCEGGSWEGNGKDVIAMVNGA